MNRVLVCLTVEHDLRFVALAGALCFMSSLLAVILMKRARNAGNAARSIWLGTAGMVAGFGIWATHFVAMLAYETIVSPFYEPSLTLVSLVIAIVATTAAVVTASLVRGKGGSVAAGLLFGSGISCMHFTGMAALQFSGMIEWDRSLVISAILLAIVFSTVAFHISSHGHSGKARTLGAALMLVLGIVAMHFTAMGAVGVIGQTEAYGMGSGLSPMLMSVAITSVSVLLMLTAFVAVILARRAERVLAFRENRFRMLVQGVTDYAMYVLDTEGNVTNWNAGAQRTKGYTAEEIVGSHFSCFYSEDDRKSGLPDKALETAFRDGKFSAEGLRYRKNGKAFWAHVIIQPIYDDKGVHVGFAKITRDLTEQKQQAAKLQQASDNLSMALEHMANGICLFDDAGRVVLHNPRLCEIAGFDPDVDIVGKTLRELCDLGLRGASGEGNEADTFYRMDREHFSRPGGGDYICKIANGKTIRMVHRPFGKSGSWVSTIEDITERVQAENRISHLARHDALTGLPNRRYFLERLDTALLAAERKNERIAAVCIDLDGFKDINDTFGHAAGDRMLSTLAQRMLESSMPGEMLGRIGGDEFIAFRTFSSDNELQDFLGRINTALTARMDIGHSEFSPAASLGIAIYPQDAADRDKLLANADMAMYRSKGSLDEKISYYEAGMDEAARERRAMGRDLWGALERNEFFLVYQSQRSVRTDEITGYEVLLRWQHPVHGLVSPAVFIPIAEECGAISAIGDWVLETACREAAGWRPGYRIAVNLSPLQLANNSLPDKVRQILFDTGMPASRLELEVTESAIIGDKARALHILRQIKALGVSIAIDDFGTGYSSLETLRSFPFDKIKLDRSFVTGLETCRQSKAFVRAIVALGKSLDVSVLAEGVETEAQMRVLEAENCDEVQGFLFGKPGRFEGEEDRETLRSCA